MLPDGSLIIHGRIDTQVKLRGLRIELQEIHAIALRTGLTRKCKSVLITHKDPKSQQIALFYVPLGHEGTEFQVLPSTACTRGQARTLRNALQSALPDYMVPAFIYPISRLPLTSSGKVDESTLCSSVKEFTTSVLNDYHLAEDQSDIHSDWSHTETVIANAITNLCGKDMSEISRWTTFSALGLDSISAMPVARKLQIDLQKRVPLSLLLRNPNINRLASAIDELGPTPGLISSNTPLLPDELVQAMRDRFTSEEQSVSKVLPCTPLQEAMIMPLLNHSSITADNAVTYYNQMLFRLYIPYKVIMGLWDKVIQRHEILRTIFVTTDNIRHPVVQIILDNYNHTWQILKTEEAAVYKRASQHMISVSNITAFSRPPLALAIIQTENSGDYLSFVCHHAMYDGISMQIVLSEIEAMYHGRQIPAPPPLEPFIRATQVPHLGQESFWKQLFLDFQPTSLRCKDYADDTMARSVRINASDRSLTSVESQLREIGISMLSLIQTAWAITLSMLTRKSDVSFGNVVTGRSISLDMVDNLVAPCFNTLPIRKHLSSSSFLIDLMQDFQNLHAKMSQYQFTSLRRIQKETCQQTRLFDTLVILQPPTAPLDGTIWSLEYEDGIMDVRFCFGTHTV